MEFEDFVHQFRRLTSARLDEFNKIIARMDKEITQVRTPSPIRRQMRYRTKVQSVLRSQRRP